MKNTYEKCIDCGEPKITKWQQRVPRCYKCSKKRVPNRGGHCYSHCIDCGKKKSRPNEYPRCKSCSKKLLWKDEEFKAKQDIAHNDPDFIKQQHDSHVTIWSNQEKRDQHRQRQLESWSSPELKARHSETLKRSYAEIFSSDKARYDSICAFLAQHSEKAPHWPNDEDYGEEFNSWLKERIRERDGFHCVLCGKSQYANGVALSVHHINYLKNDNRPENLVSLCKKCHTRTNSKRTYWQEVFTTYFYRQPLQDWQRKVVVTSIGWQPIEGDCQAR